MRPWRDIYLIESNDQHSCWNTPGKTCYSAAIALCRRLEDSISNAEGKDQYEKEKECVLTSTNWDWYDWLSRIQTVFDMARAIISGRLSAYDKGYISKSVSKWVWKRRRTNQAVGFRMACKFQHHDTKRNILVLEMVSHEPIDLVAARIPTF